MHGIAHAKSAKAATVNTKRIKVDLTQQIVEAFDIAERVFRFECIFTRDRKALHQYHGLGFDVVRAFKKEVTDWFGSHGCVRLREDDAKMLFHWAPPGTSVWVE